MVRQRSRSTVVPGFVLTVEPKELTAAAGSKSEIPLTVKVTRRGGFDGPIELQWIFPGQKLPGGRIEAGRSEAKLSLKLPEKVSEGNLEVKLTAVATVGGEVRNREYPIKLTVTAPKPGGK